MVGDVALAGAAIAERLAERRNVDPKGSLFDDGLGPSPRNQLVFRNRLAGARDERSQNVERTAPEAQRLPPSDSIRWAGINRNDPKVKTSSSIGQSPPEACAIGTDRGGLSQALRAGIAQAVGISVGYV